MKSKYFEEPKEMKAKHEHSHEHDGKYFKQIAKHKSDKLMPGSKMDSESCYEHDRSDKY